MRTARLSAVPALLALFFCAAPSFAAEEPAPEGSTPPAEISPVPAPAPPPEIGRYRLLEGQFAASSLGGEQTSERHLFKLDTVTGSVWIGRQLQFVDKKTGRMVQQRYWEPFEQYLTSAPGK